MSSRMSICSAGSEGSASGSKRRDAGQCSFANLMPSDSGTCATTGPACPSSGMSTTSRESVELWPTIRSNASTGQCDHGEGAADIQTVVQHHSSSPLGSRVSRPVPPVSARAVEMTAGSGRRISGWLSGCGPAGACLKTLLDSRAWRHPLRSLAWTLRGYGMCPDEPSLKSSRDWPLFDTSCLSTGTGFPGFRLCRLRVLEPGTDGTGCSSLPDEVAMWATAGSRDWKDSAGMARTGMNPDGTERQRDDQLARQVAAHVELWSTCRASDGEKGGPNQCFGAGGMPLTAQAHSQTGGTPGSNAGPMASGGQLNPDFTCWLMGYPAGWLNSRDSETPSSRKSRKSSGGPSSKLKGS